jgi:hypothetical protein
MLKPLGGEIFEGICVSRRCNAEFIDEAHRILGFQESQGIPVTPD